MRRLLVQVREGLDLQSLRVRFSEEVHSITLNGFREIALQSYSGNGNGGSSVPRIFHLASEKILWIHKTEIVRQMVSDGIRRRNGGCRCKDEYAFFTGACGNGRGRVIGEVVISKPAWKKRRTSEADDELIELLAEGLRRWVATQIREKKVVHEVIGDGAEWAQGAQEFALRALSLVETNGGPKNGHAGNVLVAGKR